MKKIICALLSACLLLPCAVPFVAAAEREKKDAANENKQPSDAPSTELVEDADPFIIIRGMDFGGLIKDAGTEKEENVSVKLTFGGIVGALGKAAACRGALQGGGRAGNGDCRRALLRPGRHQPENGH